MTEQKAQILADNPVAAWLLEGDYDSEVAGVPVLTVVPGEGDASVQMQDSDAPPGFTHSALITQDFGTPQSNPAGLEWATPGTALPIFSSIGSWEVWVKLPSSFAGIADEDWANIVSANDRLSIRRESSTTSGLIATFRNPSNSDVLNASLGQITGEWLHFVVTYDGTTATAYRNGFALTSSNSTAGLATEIDNLVFGYQYNAPLNGSKRRRLTVRIGAFALFDYALSPERVLAHYLGEPVFDQKKQILQDSPVGAWFFEGNFEPEIAGTPALTEVIGDGGSLQFVDGPPGFDSAVRIDPGSEISGLEWVDPGNPLPIYNGVGSWEVWFRRTGFWSNNVAQVVGANDRIGLRRDGTSNNTLLATLRNNSNSNIFNATNAVPQDTWQHAVVTYDGSVARLYDNGYEAASESATNTLATNVDSLTFGFQYSAPTGGDRRRPIDNTDIGAFAIYDYALTAQQVVDHYIGTEVDTDEPGYSLLVSDVSFEIKSSSIEIIQIHDTNISNVNIDYHINVIELTQSHLFSIDDISLTAYTDNTNITQLHVTIIDDTSLSISLNVINVNQTHNINVDDISLSIEADTINVLESHIFNVDNTNLSVNVGEIAANQTHIFNIDNTNLSVNVDTIEVLESHIFNVGDIKINILPDDVRTEQIHEIKVIDLHLNNFVDVINIHQTHQMDFLDINSIISIDNININQNHNINIGDNELFVNIDAFEINQTYLLNSSDIEIDILPDAVTVQQSSPDNLLISNVTGITISPDDISVVQIYNIIVENVELAATPDSILVNQAHAAIIQNIELRADIDEVELVHQHELSIFDPISNIFVNDIVIDQIHNISVANVNLIVSPDPLSIIEIYQLLIAQQNFSITIDPIDLIQEHNIGTENVNLNVQFETSSIDILHILSIDVFDIKANVNDSLLQQNHIMQTNDVELLVKPHQFSFKALDIEFVDGSNSIQITDSRNRIELINIINTII